MLMTEPDTEKLIALEIPSSLEELRIPSLSDDHIHLWHAEPQKRRSLLPHLSTLLSSDENERRARFRFAAAREDFAFARGLLRTLLGAYLAMDPREVRFCYSEHGKPFLGSQGAEPTLQFNLSHTQGAVLLGICRKRSIGVDVERIREDLDPKEIAGRFFSPFEQGVLRELPKAEQRPAFFRCWTRKEAFLKARGHGLSYPLDLFDVSFRAGENEVKLTTRPDREEAQPWQILEAAAPEGCAAAVAVARSDGSSTWPAPAEGQESRDRGAKRKQSRTTSF